MTKQFEKPVNRFLFLVILSAALAVCGITVSSAGELSGPSANQPEGAAYISIVEQLDTQEIEREIYNESGEKRMMDLVASIEEDPDSVWRIFKEVNAVFMGDSRVMGFYMNDLMYESHIIADGGATIHDIPNGYDTLQMLQPGLLVLAYGINDMNTTDLWPDVDAYIAELNETMEELTQLLPDTYIYVQSIIPTNEIGIENSPKWARVPEWNAAIKANCEEHGWRYMDIADFVYEHEDVYDSDGVHFQIPVYQWWGEEILKQFLLDSGWAGSDE